MAAFIWNNINGQNTKEEIIDIVLNGIIDYNEHTKEDIVKYCSDFINTLIKKSLLEKRIL